MSNISIKKQTVNGLVWSAVDVFSRVGITFIFGIILARLLTPEDFGVIALLTIFIAVSNVFVDSGFSNAIIRKQDITEIDKSTAFYFNIIVGVFFYLILFLIAPCVSSFYEEPILTRLLRFTGLSVIANSFSIVQQSVLTINIDFKKQAVVSVVSAILSGSVGILLALNDFGVWALAVQQVVASYVRTFMLWFTIRWKPIIAFSRNSFNYLFGFGSKLLVSGLLNTIWVYLYPILIGKFFSSHSLGLFSRADQFSKLPASNITTILQRVTFPVLSKIQTEKDRLSNNYRKVIRLSIFIIFPVMTLMSAVSEPLVLILLGEKWIRCVDYLKILCFAMMFYPIHAINLNLLQVVGRSDLFLKLEIIKKLLSLVILILTIPNGLVAMCYGLLLDSVISLIINTYYTGKLIEVTILIQLKDLVCSFILSLLTWVISSVFIINVSGPWLQLIGALSIGITFYLICSYFINRSDTMEIVNIIRK